MDILCRLHLHFLTIIPMNVSPVNSFRPVKSPCQISSQNLIASAFPNIYTNDAMNIVWGDGSRLWLRGMTLRTFHYLVSE